MIRSIFNATLIILVLFAMTCEKDDATPQVDANGLSPAINDLVSEENLTALIDLGIQINSGATPPVLSGEYVLSTCYIAESSAGDIVGTVVEDFFVKLYDQNNLEITVDYKHGTQVGQAVGSYIVGDDCSFSVFIEVNEINTPSGSSAKLVLVVSGEIVNKGSKNMEVANLMLDNNNNSAGIWIPNGTGRLFKDQDNFSELVGEDPGWYTKLPDCPCEFSEDLNNQRELCGKWEVCDGASEAFHYGATYEIRWYSDEKDQAGQQCTYDANKKLITAGIAAGSPDLFSPEGCGYGDFLNSIGIFIGCDGNPHCEADVKPWMSGNAETIPCWQYLQNWPANKGNACAANNPVTDIQHMLTLIGSMSCEDATLLIKSASEDDDDDIASELKNYLLGEPSVLSDPQLITLLQDWKTAEQNDLITDDDLIVLIDLAISNLQ